MPVPRSAVWEVLTDPQCLTEMTPLLDGIRVDGDRWRWGDEEIDTASWAELRSLCNRLLLAIVGG